MVASPQVLAQSQSPFDMEQLRLQQQHQQLQQQYLMPNQAFASPAPSLNDFLGGQQHQQQYQQQQPLQTSSHTYGRALPQLPQHLQAQPHAEFGTVQPPPSLVNYLGGQQQQQQQMRPGSSGSSGSGAGLVMDDELSAYMHQQGHQ
jgi:hypothetical protein